MPNNHDDMWLENAIHSLPAVDLPADLARRIAQIPIEHSQGFVWPNFGGLRMFGSWAVCGVLGLIFGSFVDMSLLSEPLTFTNASEDEFGLTDDPVLDVVARAWVVDSEQMFGAEESVQ